MSQKLKIFLRELAAFFIVVVVIGLACIACTPQNSNLRDESAAVEASGRIPKILSEINKALNTVELVPLK